MNVTCICFPFALPYLSNSEYLFRYSVICVFFGRMLIQIHGPFLNKVFFGWGTKLFDFLIYLVNLLSNIWFEIIFQIHRLSFHFWLHNFLVLCDPTYVCFALLFVLLASYLKQIPKSVFLFGILQFYILYLDFSSALTFVYGIKIQFYYFCMGAIQFSQYELLEKLYFFSTLCICSSLAED